MKCCFEGEFLPNDQPLVTVQNRSYKWGDGCFETMKVQHGRLILEELHFDRLFTSLDLLQISRSDQFTQAKLLENILELCRQNNCFQSARVRVAVYRKEDNTTGYSIEASPFDEKMNRWEPEGLKLCLYPYARKSMDAFANIKSASFLPYVMAKRYAEEQGMDDAIVLNAEKF